MTDEERNAIVAYRMENARRTSVEKGEFYTLIFNKRSSGDYEDFISHDQKTVNELYPLALDFIDSIDRLLEKK